MTDMPQQGGLDLSLPATDASGRPPEPAAVRQWLAEQPKLNEAQAFDTVLARLGGLNRVAMPPQQRFEIAEGFLPEVEYLADKLAQRCELLEFPLPEQDRQLSERLQALLEEMAVGYKHVLNGLAATQAPTDATLVVIRTALLQAMRLLAQRILQAYAVYHAAPAGVWGELHRLYRYAERIDVARTRVEHLADLTIGDIYKRAILLALANPFHLMQGEARITYEKLAKWALACSIRHPREFPPQAPEFFYAGRCYADLDGDAPPGFGRTGQPHTPGDARLFEFVPVVRIVEDRIRQMTLKEQLPMAERLERDLLRRLRNAWTGRAERGASRVGHGGELQVVGGLRACHHLLSGNTDYHPEQDEIALHGKDFQGASRLSLVPLEEESWRQEDTRGKLEQGLLKPRSYGFDMEHKEDDVWERTQRVGSQRATQLEARVENRLLNRRGMVRQRDVSATGIGAEYAGEASLRFRVGDLVGIPEDGANQSGIELAMVCWLRDSEAGGLSLGLTRIEGRPAAVAVRGIEGMGAGGDYHRALTVYADNLRALIAPAGSFDIGSVLLVNTGSELELNVLRRIVRSTRGFTEYAVDSVAIGGARHEHIIASLYKILERAT
jgi:hypothetical protein